MTLFFNVTYEAAYMCPAGLIVALGLLAQLVDGRRGRLQREDGGVLDSSRTSWHLLLGNNGRDCRLNGGRRLTHAFGINLALGWRRLWLTDNSWRQ